ncbi:RnfABCDGE type electron transport complex subunit D [Pseudomonas sp. RIT-PI-AD]|uniref:RnfABCDGE type electron transport complex subunit D n=1 Tax=Pseudomonas sp. RIT-PI-AD TaxID=3035294 RepID=UPI0021DA1BBF|nr:RnfABCDGE type electron transport complex subunit D [Pseudomonas sp. RIT-PI-AD]
MTSLRPEALLLDPRPAMRDVALACLPGLATLFWLYGWAVPLQLILCLASGLACEALVRHWRHRRPMPAERALFGRPLLAEGGGLVSALLLAIALPAGSPWWLSVCATAFASLFGKALFGGFGQNPLNPAMLGYAFALVAFPAQMSHWPAPDAFGSPLAASQQVFGFGAPAVDGWSQATLLDSLKHNDRLTLDELFQRDPAFGRVGGRGVEGVNLAFLLGGLYLLKRRVIAWQIPLGVLGALFVASLFGWNGSGSDSHGSPLLHLFTGASMLGAFFIASEPVTAPRGARARLLFGIGIGLLTYLIRAYGSYPDGLAFAVLLMNLAVPALERLERRQAGEHA